MKQVKKKRRGLTSVQIRPHVSKMLDAYTQKGVSKSAVINEALKQYLIEKEFQHIREQLTPYAQAKGIYTDEDVDRLLK